MFSHLCQCAAYSVRFPFYARQDRSKIQATMARDQITKPVEDVGAVVLANAAVLVSGQVRQLLSSVVSLST